MLKFFATCGAIILALAVILVVAIVEHLLRSQEQVLDDGSRLRTRFLANTGIYGWLTAIGVGVLVGLIVFFSTRIHGSSLWLSVPFYVIMLALMGFTTYKCLRDAARPREVIAFIVLVWLLFLGFRVVAAAFYALVGGGFWGSVILTIPKILHIVLPLIFIGNALIYHYNDTRERKNIWRILGWICYGIAAVILILFIIFGFKWGQITRKPAVEPSPSPVVTAEPTTTPTPTPTTATTPKPTTQPTETKSLVVFHHDEVLVDNEGKTGEELEKAKLNDYDFGEDAVLKILLKKIEKKELKVDDIKGKTEKELFEMVTREEVLEEFLSSVHEDPAKLAACVAWYDACMRTDLLGDFFVNVKGREEAWMHCINDAAKAWEKDEKAFEEAYERFATAIKHTNSYTVEYVESGLTDQMYMYGYTIGERPTVIVMETAQEWGVVLRFVNIVKNNPVEFSYRATCDFQPVNVAEVMGVTPKVNPVNPKKPPVKDPTQGTPVGGNDNRGAGPNTNNGVGATTGTGDLPTNSNHETLGEYWEDIADLERANDTTREAGDPNTPTAPPPSSGTDVDSNANSGNGYGNIDRPSTDHGGATYDDSHGREHSVSDESAGDEWGGPPD